MAVARKKFVIIDGKSVFYRGYYAMPGLSTNDGTPTGGVYGFAVMALEVLKRLKPDYVCVAWDKPKTNIRKRTDLYPEYKAGRKSPPQDFYDQIPILHELLDAFGWPLYELDDYEADDIMATLADQAKEEDIETMLITSDLDALQAVNSHTHVYALKKGLSNIELFKPESFKEKYGLEPSQFLDLKALMGDSSDNIPGVAGIGKKGATDLLQEYGSLDAIYENLDLLKNSVRKKLEDGRDMAYLSKQLATLWTDAPIKLDLKAVDGSKCDPVKVKEELQKLEFRTLLRQLPDAMQMSQEQVEQNNIQEFTVSETAAHAISSDADLKKLVSKKPTELYVYSRAAGTYGNKPLVLLVSLDGKKTYHIDVTKVSTPVLKELFAAKPQLIGYDIKSTLKVLLELGIAMPPIGHDVLIGSFLINSLRREKTLTELAQADIGYQGELETVATDELIVKGAEIIEVLRALYLQQATALEELPKVQKLADDIEWPVIRVLASMEHRGIKLDTDYLGMMSEQLTDAVSDLEQQIYGYADQEFNISSPSQLAEILFTTLKLPTNGIKKGKTGYSTAASELAKLRGEHEIIDFISQYREVTKLKSTYVDTLPELVDDNSRLHTTFALTVAQTGRLSSHDPNLQNIPVRSELGKKIRTAFVAGEGNVFISADYSQFELRLAAYLCNDKDLIDMFNRDVDVHVATAAEVYERRPEDITKNMRRDAKVVNFGVMYGLSSHGLVQATGMSYDQATHFIKRYFEVRPKLQGYIDEIKKQAKDEGYVETIFGRRRPTPDVRSNVFPIREAAYRAAVNMPFQGSAADIMKLAMVQLHEKLQGTDCNLLLQIHDSVIAECPAGQAEVFATLIKETMEGVVNLPIKMTVDTDTGKTWGEL